MVDTEGTISRTDLPPFAHLHDLSCRIQIAAEHEAENKETSPETGPCSTSTTSSDRINTACLLLVEWLLEEQKRLAN